MTFLIILICYYIAIFTTSPVITILHELGHGLSYLILTKPERVDIYIGTYDKDKYTFRFRLGKLFFNVKLSFPLIRGIGICRSSKMETIATNQIIILCAGVTFNILIAAVAGYFAFSSNIHGAIKLYCFVLIIFSMSSVYTNLLNKTIVIGNGNYLQSDGAQIKFVWAMRKYYEKYSEALTLINANKHGQAAEMLQDIFGKIKFNERITRRFMELFYLCNDYRDCIKCFEILQNKTLPETSDYIIAGAAYCLLNEHEAAINTNLKALATDKKNKYIIVNLACSYIKLEEFITAETYLQKALEIDPDFEYTYINWGCLYTKIHKYDEAKIMLEKAISLNDQDPYFYKYLGELFLEINEPENAILNFNKCKELNLIFDVEKELNKAETLLKNKSHPAKSSS